MSVEGWLAVAEMARRRAASWRESAQAYTRESWKREALEEARRAENDAAYYAFKAECERDWTAYQRTRETVK